LEGAEQLDHSSKMDSFSGKRDLAKFSWVGTGFHGFGEVPHSIAGRDKVDFGGVGLWNQVEISWLGVGFSWLVVAVSVVTLGRGESLLL
jgi:hypothetical protein